MQNESHTCAGEGVDPFLELDGLRALAGEGEIDLATLRAIRLGAALCELRERGTRDFVALEAEILSDLCVLRHQRNDRAGACGLARACLELAPQHALARENLALIEAQPGSPAEDRTEDPLASLLNPWVRQALDLAQREEGLSGKDVIEVGGAVPEEHARATGASSWSGFYLGAERKCAPGYEIRDADARKLPWPDQSFDVAFSSCAFEHIQELPRALKEIARVLRPGGALILSVPLYMRAWTFFDELVGHCRRYEPADLEQLLAAHGFVLAESAAYGMQPSSTTLLKLGMWWLERFPVHAMNVYNRVVMPLALAFQKRLEFAPGLVRDPRVDEVVLVCRRSAGIER